MRALVPGEDERQDQRRGAVAQHRVAGVAGREVAEAAGQRLAGHAGAGAVADGLQEQHDQQRRVAGRHRQDRPPAAADQGAGQTGHGQRDHRHLDLERHAVDGDAAAEVGDAFEHRPAVLAVWSACAVFWTWSRAQRSNEVRNVGRARTSAHSTRKTPSRVSGIRRPAAAGRVPAVPRSVCRAPLPADRRFRVPTPGSAICASVIKTNSCIRDRLACRYGTRHHHHRGRPGYRPCHRAAPGPRRPRHRLQLPQRRRRGRGDRRGGPRARPPLRGGEDGHRRRGGRRAAVRHRDRPSSAG